MKNTRKILSLMLAVLMLVSAVPIGVNAASYYTINGVTVHNTDFSSSPDDCWTYANNIYNKIWGQRFSNSFSDSNNSLRNLSDSQLLLNATNLKNFVSHAALGSCLRICNSEYLHGTDGWGHSQIIVHKDANGFTVFEGGLTASPHRREKYYTWSEYCSTNWLGGTYQYIKYIKWPGASAYSAAAPEPTSILYPTDGGIYKIASGVGNNMYLDFACTSNNVQIYENCDSHSDPAYVKSQYFTFTHVGDGWYTIKNVGNDKYLDIYMGNPTSGTNIQQCHYIGGDAQLYRFYDAGNGYCYIKSKLGTYVDVANGDKANNTNVWAYAFNGSDAQKWKLIQKNVPKYEFDANIIINDAGYMGGLSGFTFDVYYNDSLAHNDVYDCCEMIPIGTKWEIKDTKYPDGYTFIDGNTSGTVLGNVDARLNFKSMHEFDVNLIISDALYVNGLSGFTYDVYFNDSLAFNDVSDCCEIVPFGTKWEIRDIKYPSGYSFVGESTSGVVTDFCDFRLVFNCTHSSTEVRNAKNATCTAEGYTGDTYCKGCGIKTKSGTTIAKTAHNSNITIPAVAATCTKTGLTEGKKCSACGTITVAQQTVAKASHSYTSTVTTPATCKGTGVKTYTCSKCVDSYTESIAKNASNHTGGTEIRNTKSATCSAEGYTGDTYCKGCGVKIKSGTAIAKTAHNSNTTIPAIAATCTKTGLTEGKKCSACGTITVAQQTVAKASHSYTLEVIKAPTCSEKGINYYTCLCGNSYVEYTDETKHTYGSDGICTECGDYNKSYDKENSDPSSDCTCNCHKSGFAGLIWKILNFFHKLFKINPVCKCGVSHY